MLHQLCRLANQAPTGYYRDRWQDTAQFLPAGRYQSAHPDDLGVMAEPCSAWASNRQRLVRGQNKVTDKSNEIMAPPELLGFKLWSGGPAHISGEDGQWHSAIPRAIALT